MIIERYGVKVDLSYEHKTSCPKCVSRGRDVNGDNLHVYGLDSDDRHLGAFCFSCNYTIPSEEWIEENGEEIEEEEAIEMSGEWSREKFDKLMANTTTNSRGWRGIKPETAKELGFRFEYCTQTGEVENVYFPITQGITKGVSGFEALTGYKGRTKDKKFFSVGSFSKESDLHGQGKFKSASNWLVITAGEVDYASVYQMLKEHNKGSKFEMPAVVSSVIGEGASASQIRLHYEWMTRFKRIIIIYDEDMAGYVAEEKVSKVLPKDVPLFTVKLRYNDCNEYLVNGKEDEFITDFFGMRPRTLDGVKSSYDAFNEIGEEVERDFISLPKYMWRLQEKMGGGLRRGVIYNFAASTGVSKTTHIRNIVYHIIMNTDLKPTIISLEETAATYALNLLQVHAKENFTFGKDRGEIVNYLNTPKMKKLQKELMLDEEGNPRFFIIDERSGDIKQLEKQMEKVYYEQGSQLVVIDVLSDALRGSNADKAEDHMAWQRRMNKEGLTIINTHHTRKMPTSKDGVEIEPTEWDVLGTGSFIQSGYGNILFHRDKNSDCNIVRNTTRVTLPKIRGGITGDAGKWYWDFNTHQCYDLEDWLEENPHMVPKEGGNDG